MPTSTSEYRLARSDARIRSAIDAVVTMDSDGLVVEWNPAAERMFGWSRDEVVGRDMADVVVPERLRAAHRAGFRRYLKTRRGLILDQRLEMPALRHDGTEISVELTITAFEAVGQTWFSGWIRDLSELRAERAARVSLEHASERLVQQNRSLRELDTLKTELVASVSHELRTPLTAIVGFAELLTDPQEGLSADHLMFVNTIMHNAQRLTQLIEDLLVLNHLDADTLRLQPTAQDPRPLVRYVVDAVRDRATARDIGLSLTTSEGPPACMFDAPRLQQLASNLIGNAVKFTPAGGDPVAVFMSWDGGAWILRIADHGIGVPAGELDDLGTRFYRATNAVEEFSSGTGLGLAVSKAIVDEHGGWLAISSVEGHGTTVTATFPCSDDPERRL
jgi:PAS domain S-box-containing protein